MPWSAARPCRYMGCPGLTRDRDGVCPAHKARAAEDRKAYDRQRGSPSQRGYGHAWRMLRATILARDPTCTICGRAASAHVDHIVARAKGGSDDESNLRGVCHSCHSVKTARLDIPAWQRRPR